MSGRSRRTGRRGQNRPLAIARGSHVVPSGTRGGSILCRRLTLRLVWPGLAEQPLQERPSREPHHNAAAANAAG
jgi:hypothetical protein